MNPETGVTTLWGYINQVLFAMIARISMHIIRQISSQVRVPKCATGSIKQSCLPWNQTINNTSLTTQKLGLSKTDEFCIKAYVVRVNNNCFTEYQVRKSKLLSRLHNTGHPQNKKLLPWPDTFSWVMSVSMWTVNRMELNTPSLCLTPLVTANFCETWSAHQTAILLGSIPHKQKPDNRSTPVSIQLVVGSGQWYQRLFTQL